MKLLNVNAINFKGFSNLSIDLAGKSTVIFGVNGVGKTSFLSILNILSWNWLSRLNPAQGNAFKSLNSELVRFGSSRMEISYTVEMDGEPHELKKAYTKARLGKGASTESYKKLYDAFIEAFVAQYGDEKTNLPIWVSYGTNRSVTDIPLRIRKEHSFSRETALERAIENRPDFKTFFEWFRNQEDYELEKAREEGNLNYKDASLECVKKAIHSMLPEFDNLKVKRNPLRMTVEKKEASKKDGIELRIDQLSDGEKCTIALFGDLARRLALANPNLKDPLQGEGIVLIDEIELHLHPSWQRKILGILKKTFPNIQFIITTHSPQVLGEADPSNTILKLENRESFGLIASTISRMDNLDSNTILEDYMGTSHIDENYQNKLDYIYSLIGDRHLNEAEAEIEKFSEFGANIMDIEELREALKWERYRYDIHP